MQKLGNSPANQSFQSDSSCHRKLGSRTRKNKIQHRGPNLHVCVLVWNQGRQHGIMVENEKYERSATILRLYGKPEWRGMRYI